MNRTRIRGVCLPIGLLLVVGGCSGGPPRTVPPEIDADAAAQQAIVLYDTDHDGSISGKELDKCPGIKAAIEHYDVNHNGKITAAAIAARIREWQESKVGTTVVNVRVLLDGQVLEGATVTFEPEPFLGSNLATASGQTGNSGSALLTIADPQNAGGRKPGVHFGLYKVRISKQAGGRESLPARFNSQTGLGAEIGPRSEAPRFNLSSR